MLGHYALYYGIYTAMGAIINNLVSPFGYTTSSTTLFAATFILAGLISSFIVSGYIDKTKKYLKVFRVLSIASLVTGSCMIFMMP